LLIERGLTSLATLRGEKEPLRLLLKSAVEDLY